MYKFNGIVLIVFSLLQISACSTVKVPITVTHPAQINMDSFKQIAIGQIDGNVGVEFSDSLKHKLVNSKNYKILDRTQLEALLREHDISKSDLADPKKRLKVGKFLSASILISGRADQSYAEELKSDIKECKSKGKKYTCTAYTRTGGIKSTGSIDVINVETGEILANKLIRNKCNDWAYEEDKKPRPLNKERLKADCINYDVTKVFRTINPWKETIQMRFTKNKHLPELEHGINMAKMGDLSKAIEQFVKAVHSAESNPSLAAKIKAMAYWNLGLAYEYTHQFNKAGDAFVKGFSYSSEKRFIREKKNVEKMRKERLMMLGQK